MKLTSKNVTDIIRDCLWKPEEILSPDTLPDNTVFGEGITMRMGFNPERLQEHKEDVRSMLLELPETFLASKGGGWSFLNACITKDGVQWGEHRNVEELILLGNALGLVKFTVPRALWSAFPGGMPYFTVKDTEK